MQAVTCHRVVLLSWQIPFPTACWGKWGTVDIQINVFACLFLFSSPTAPPTPTNYCESASARSYCASRQWGVGERKVGGLGELPQEWEEGEGGHSVTFKSWLDVIVIIVCFVFATAVIETLAAGLCSSSRLAMAALCGKVLISKLSNSGVAPQHMKSGLILSFVSGIHFPAS